MSQTITSKTFHCCMAIDYLISKARRPRQLDGIFVERETKRPLPGEEVVEMAIDFASRGYEVIPSCDHHDERGFCRGHEQEADQS
ncbi:MAG TPA: hypothetical protein DCR72_14480 [Pseudomonas sp.]|nr:hypothetical protein [Pseudomonas sp.]